MVMHILDETFFVIPENYFRLCLRPLTPSLKTLYVLRASTPLV